MPRSTHHSTRTSRLDRFTTLWPKRAVTRRSDEIDAIRMPAALGQSVWVDELSRDEIEPDALRGLVEREGIAGALCIRMQPLEPADQPGPFADAAATLSHHLAVRDARDAADLLQNRHLLSAGRDGLVSVEVLPELLRDPKRTLDEARELWGAIARRNVVIAVPGIRSNLPVIRELTVAGINLNVTMLYGTEHYREAFDAYCAGLEARSARGEAISHVQFIASFRIDAVDRRVAALIDERPGGNARGHDSPRALAAQSGIAHATVIQRRALAFASSERFSALAAHGAQRPRLLWRLGENANSPHAIIRYLDSLVRSGALCAMPLAAVESCARTGILAWRRYPVPIEQEFASAMQVVVALRKAGVDLDAVAHELQAGSAMRGGVAGSTTL